LIIAALFVIAAVGRHASASRDVPPPQTSWRMKVNSVPIDELMTLPGMTSRRAKALISAREKRGGFDRVLDLTAVPGITPGYVRRIENMIDISK